MRLKITKEIDGVIYKKCSGSRGCGEFFTLSSFPKKTVRGKERVKAFCYDCQREYMRSFRSGEFEKVDMEEIGDRFYRYDEPYGDLVQRVNWAGTGRPVITGLFGCV